MSKHPTVDGAALERGRGDIRFVTLAIAPFGALFAVLTGAEPRALIRGAPVAVAASLIAHAAGGARYLPRPWPALLFAPWFLKEIFVSAWALGRRLLARDPGFSPGVVCYPLRLESEGARAAFMNAVTLTPGTLSARLHGDALEVHALDADEDVAAALAPLEGRVGRLYGERLA